MRTKPHSLFSQRFRRAEKQYFTFDGYCIMNDKLSGDALKTYRNVQKMHKSIRAEYIRKASVVIDTIIAKHTRKK